MNLRQCSGGYPDAKSIKDVSSRLGTGIYFTDSQGYECDILAGALCTHDARFSYVLQRSKPDSMPVEVTIQIHLRDLETNKSCNIKTYNPFFGANIRYFAWHGDTAILIYREKHRTYAVKFGSVWPPIFLEIGDRWVIDHDKLTTIDRTNQCVLLSIPNLNKLSRGIDSNITPPELEGFLDWPENAG